jgi:hypothetical protein
MDNEALKFLAGALALVISTASAEFTIANFVNGVRDGFHAGRAGTAKRWKTLSQWFDLTWGYGLGIAFNIVFFLVAKLLYQQTFGSHLAPYASFLWWLYLINLIAWIAGMFIDCVRVYLTRNEELKTDVSVKELTTLLRGALPQAPAPPATPPAGPSAAVP